VLMYRVTHRRMSIWKSTGRGMVGGSITRNERESHLPRKDLHKLSSHIPANILESACDLPGENVPPVNPTRTLPSPRSSTVSKPSCTTLNDTPKRFSSRRPSRLTTNATSSNPMIPLPPRELCLHTCWIERVRRMPRPCPAVSRRGERIRLLSTACPCPKSGGSPRRRCSRSSRPDRKSQRVGSGWSTRPRSSERVSPESP
jgi:hypothetical protein